MVFNTSTCLKEIKKISFDVFLTCWSCFNMFFNFLCVFRVCIARRARSESTWTLQVRCTTETDFCRTSNKNQTVSKVLLWEAISGWLLSYTEKSNFMNVIFCMGDVVTFRYTKSAELFCGIQINQQENLLSLCPYSCFLSKRCGCIAKPVSYRTGVLLDVGVGALIPESFKRSHFGC